MEQEVLDADQVFKRLAKEVSDHINTLEEKIKKYGSFNIIADAIFRANSPNGPTDYYQQPTAPEYIALICLKFPYTAGYGELINARQYPHDLAEIAELTNKVITKYTFLHYHQFHSSREAGDLSGTPHIAQMLSAEELLVRNPAFEYFHWDQLEELYRIFDDYYKITLGFTVDEAIRICMTIDDFNREKMQASIEKANKTAREMYEEVMAWKHRGKALKKFYPDEFLERYKRTADESLKREFWMSMVTYQLTMMGHNLSFNANVIAEMEDVPVDAIQRFLDCLSIGFGEINPDFSKPEIMHPLKDRPIIHHEGRYICPSTSLLDYSLDRLFDKTLMADKVKKEKCKERRHDYLLDKGMGYIAEVLQTTEVYQNLEYPGGEMDGLVCCGSNIYFIEAKGHHITDRARKGYIDRIENHIEQIIKAAYQQALRTYNYLFGKKDVVFTDKKGRKITIDGSRFKNAFFISLTLEQISSISCNLKLNNSMRLFTKETFPWIVSLYDLRAICEHMEGPSYFIQYLHRRREFFSWSKFSIQDEMDILGYYLRRNLRFDEFIKDKYEDATLIHLDSMMDDFNNYYHYRYGNTKKVYPKLKHYTLQPVKDLVKALEQAEQLYGKDAGAQILELGSDTKKKLMEYIRKIKKMKRKDTQNHDFRIGGSDEGKDWMLSYWVGPETDLFYQYFENHIQKTFDKEKDVHRYIAILDTGVNGYNFKRILYFQR